MPLCRTLDENHRIYVDRVFPAVHTPIHRSFRYRAVLGVGGNVEDTRRRLHHLWFYLRRQRLLQPVRSGILLKNPPFGYVEQDDFINTTIEIATSLEPRMLLRLLWRIEKHFGRKRSFPNAPRTLDLDMIFFENRVLTYPELIVPHPHWRMRLSVRIPLRSMRRTFRREYENFDI
ncbi:MAG: 2-amino-4-hydroxy-6-hydroxymethyldihydropteridine diphosphokinase [Sulfuricurvum sp.]|jgi:2-amino-4-hydroxy-6-hydroxymethyldihydropteridine diphosphokinase|uniref:2-amino-4-hydroxy-6- hydroxymethyldihydropteridine diphosphokinase n=1 Tax=Sulfuricurvum sp. TaxID=2025608 RepID=UPI0025D584D4|nr:2-amino-4-hydroxy-6-hydroxymethyldihydropteridine diphosphokinase [Sulfuricurvum sp.]MCK9373081.1 2-amino-4-hydroxy-6-hydroxymethyldihydropteridine diphosphokinase [Sulfuricurvum sp.]